MIPIMRIECTGHGRPPGTTLRKATTHTRFRASRPSKYRVSTEQHAAMVSASSEQPNLMDASSMAASLGSVGNSAICRPNGSFWKTNDASRLYTRHNAHECNMCRQQTQGLWCIRQSRYWWRNDGKGPTAYQIALVVNGPKGVQQLQGANECFSGWRIHEFKVHNVRDTQCF